NTSSVSSGPMMYSGAPLLTAASVSGAGGAVVPQAVSPAVAKSNNATRRGRIRRRMNRPVNVHLPEVSRPEPFPNAFQSRCSAARIASRAAFAGRPENCADRRGNDGIGTKTSPFEEGTTPLAGKGSRLGEGRPARNDGRGGAPHRPGNSSVR